MFLCGGISVLIECLGTIMFGHESEVFEGMR